MIEQLQKEVEQRVNEIRPYMKEVLKLYLARFPEYEIQFVRYSWKFLDFPQVLMLKCKYWSSTTIPKPSLETLEQVNKVFRANKAEIKLEIKFKDIKKDCKRLLTNTDYMFLTDYRFEDQNLKTYYIEYRKYLRSFPSTLSRDQIMEAQVLNFEEWKQVKGY
jgi:hypothetical protein